MRVKLRLVIADDLGLIDERPGGGDMAVRARGGFGGETGQTSAFRRGKGRK